MKTKGLVRAIGIGVRDHAFHRRMMETGECDVVLTFHDYNLLDQSALEGVLEPAAEHGVGVLNGTSLYQGLLSGEHPMSVLERVKAREPRLDWYAAFSDAARRAYALWEWCREWGISLLALNLQFCVRARDESEAPTIAANLMGAASPEEIEQDVAAMSVEIPGAMWAALEERLAEGD